MELVEEKKSENSRSCDIPCENEIPLDYNECPEKEICLCDAPQVPEPFNVEQACEISSSSSSQSFQADNDELIKGYQIDVEKRKDDLYKLLTELLKKSRDISRIENEIYTKRSENELRIECINGRIVEINNDESLSEDEKEKKLKCYECKKVRLNEKLEEDIRTLEDQKIEIKKYAKCQLKQLKYMSKVFVREHNRIVDQMERLKLKAACPEKIDEKMQLLENEFENEQKNLDNFKSKITNLYDEDGSVSSFSSSSESDSSSTITRTSLSKEVKLLKVRDVKNDNEMYIKHVLGKALIHGLAAITVYQPSDPIYYLANYLLHYRYNELSNIRKQLNFEELLIEREKYVERTEEALNVTCDPCGMNKEGACD